MYPPKSAPAIERFMARRSLIDGCWVWNGVTAGSIARYGYFTWNGKKAPAHRFAYEWFIGPIPEGLEVDHLCRNKLCVAPWHLEAVSHQENSNRVPWDSERMARPNSPRDEFGQYIAKEVV